MSVDTDIPSGGKKTRATRTYVEWSNSSTYSRKYSSKGIWVKEVSKK